MSKKILFLVPYPLGVVASQRFRFEQYLDILSQSGHKFTVSSFLPESRWNEFYSKGKPIQKIVLLIRGFTIRIISLFEMGNVDFVFIHREACPLGPPIIEWLVARIMRKKIIYDFDDAIWLTDKVHETPLERMLKSRWKTAAICRWSYKVSCGNDYLSSYASRFSRNVITNPTTIDTGSVHNKSLHVSPLEKKNVIIGWTGSHSTLKYLEDLEPVLLEITEKYPRVSILIIADKEAKLSIRNLVFKPWSKETEIKDLCLIDIGIMPLPDNEWTWGKCGFKALQYMALGIPAVVSPVGVNRVVVTPSYNGYWCVTKNEWMECLARLVEDEQLRQDLGRNGRDRVVSDYSVASNSQNFLSLFN
jgi:glycosyltransferase involved in cell wall biosynthesis